ncbi:hypothetical protein Tco_1233789 [Tanacetum coccineum]
MKMSHNCSILSLVVLFNCFWLLLVVLKASVKRLFDEGSSGNQIGQGDSVGGGQDANIEPVVEAADTIVEDTTLVQSRRQRKRKFVVVDVGGASHPPKKLKEGHGTLGGASIDGKSYSAIKGLLAGAVLNAEVRVATILTLPFVTTSVSSTPKLEVGDHTNFMAEPNLFDSLVRSSAPIMTTVTTVTSTVDPTLVAKEKPIKPSLFSTDSSSAGGADPNTGVFLDITGSDFLVGDDSRVCREMVDEFAPPKFFASVRGMKHDQLFTKFNVGAARQISLSAEVRMRADYNVKERRRLKFVVEKPDELLKAKDGEIKDLKAQLLLRETEAAEATRLRAWTSNLKAIKKSSGKAIALKERKKINTCKMSKMLWMMKVHELEISSAGLREKVMVYDNCIEQLEKYQDDRMKVVNDKIQQSLHGLC